jgi:[ribosomal protein S18]-alanine N-acetyltransferase
VSLRPATAADVARVAALERELFGADAWSEATVTADLDTPGRRVLVAVEDATVVGYAVTSLVGELVDLQRIAVHPDHQGRGVAGALLEAALSAADADGAEAMLLEVSTENHPALRLYRGAGFSRIDRRRGYYRDGSDAAVMRRPVRITDDGGRG